MEGASSMRQRIHFLSEHFCLLHVPIQNSSIRHSLDETVHPPLGKEHTRLPNDLFVSLNASLSLYVIYYKDRSAVKKLTTPLKRVRLGKPNFFRQSRNFLHSVEPECCHSAHKRRCLESDEPSLGRAV